ncbi:MAG: hypothetical protein V3U75_12850 [Methylococcaceae bacterium]
MLMPVANKPGWFQDSETQEIWVRAVQENLAISFCNIVGIKPDSFYTMKSRYRTMKMGSHVYVSWTHYQADAKLQLPNGKSRRFPSRHAGQELTTREIPPCPVDTSMTVEQFIKRQQEKTKHRKASSGAA